jgi:phage terminase large subunit-like protein
VGTVVQLLQDERIPAVEFPQSMSRLTPATIGLAEAAANQTFTHSGDGTLAAHVAHAQLKTTSRGRVLDKRRSTQKIDGAMGAVMAYSRARALATRPRASVYFV